MVFNKSEIRICISLCGNFCKIKRLSYKFGYQGKVVQSLIKLILGVSEL